MQISSLNDSSVHLHGSFAVLQSQLTEHFSTVMGCRPDPRFSALLQLELYAHLLNNPNEEAQKSWCERQTALIYEQYGELKTNYGSVKYDLKRWFKAIAEARPELREAVSMILEYPLQSGSAKLSQPDCLSATPLFSERAVEQLTMHMSGDLGDGDNRTLAGTVPSPPHLQTAAISITHQGGVL